MADTKAIHNPKDMQCRRSVSLRPYKIRRSGIILQFKFRDHDAIRNKWCAFMCYLGLETSVTVGSYNGI